MNPLLQDVWLVIIGVLLFGLPGYAARVLLARLAGGSRFLRTQDGATGAALESLGLSLALWPILLLYSTLLGIHFSAGLIWGILAVSGLIGVGDGLLQWRARRRQEPLPHAPGAAHGSWLVRSADWLPLLLLTAITLAARLYAVRELHIPLFGDSRHHTLMVQLILEQGGVPTTYRPYEPVDSFTYHFGFHTLAAVWAWLTGMPSWGAVLAVGQILNALAVPAAYFLGRELFRSRLAGLFAAVAVGFISAMPTYYVNWGRYTQLAGQVLLPFAMVWFMRAVERPARRWRFSRHPLPGDGPQPGGIRRFQASPVLATGGGEPWKPRDWRGWAARLGIAVIGSAGLFFTHYRVVIFYALFALAFLAIETARGSLASRERLGRARRMGRAYLKNLAGGWVAFVRGLYSRALIAGLLSGLIALPWLLNLLANYIQGLLARLRGATPEYLAEYNAPGFLGQWIGLALPGLAVLGFVLLVAGAVRVIRSGRTEATLTGGLWRGAWAGVLIGLWTVLVILAAVPATIGLPGSGAISTFTVGIALYIPFGTLAGAGLAWLVEAAALWLRAHGPRLRATLTGRLGTVVPLVLAVILLAANPGALNIDYSINSDYVADADLAAMEWIKANTPPDARFLIGSEVSYVGRAVTATDAGMWIPLLTGRKVSLPPLSTGSEMGPGGLELWQEARQVATASHALTDPAARALLRADGITYAYLGAMRPPDLTRTLDLAAMQADPAHFPPLYARDNVYIFGIK